tara:strand:- start:1013 stop:1153 length:141 start_codon:yes stop_codon:yes gene_type:complete
MQARLYVAVDLPLTVLRENITFFVFKAVIACGLINVFMGSRYNGSK